jgi:hypothetical protein
MHDSVADTDKFVSVEVRFHPDKQIIEECLVT